MRQKERKSVLVANGLRKEKCHAKQVMHSIRDPDTGSVHHDPFEMLGVWQRYYTGLFAAAPCDPSAKDDMLSKLSHRLCKYERASCEGLLTLEDCFPALSGMARGKTPGSDGFPMEFYLHFWSSLGADMLSIWFVSSTLLTRPASFPPLSIVG